MSGTATSAGSLHSKMRDIGEERNLERLGLQRWERKERGLVQEETTGEIVEVEKKHALPGRGPANQLPVGSQTPSRRYAQNRASYERRNEVIRPGACDVAQSGTRQDCRVATVLQLIGLTRDKLGTNDDQPLHKVLPYFKRYKEQFGFRSTVVDSSVMIAPR